MHILELDQSNHKLINYIVSVEKQSSIEIKGYASNIEGNNLRQIAFWNEF